MIYVQIGNAGELLWPILLFKILLMLVTGMTREKLERRESQNDRKAGTTRKSERPESNRENRKDQEIRNDRNDRCANILTNVASCGDRQYGSNLLRE